MTIKIENVLTNNIIEISSHIGKTKAICFHVNLQTGKTYGVEFNINSFIKLGENATKVYSNSCFISYDGNLSQIQGLCEDVDEFGTLWFRLAEDCLIALETEDKDIHAGDYLQIEVAPQLLEMFIIGV